MDEQIAEACYVAWYSVLPELLRDALPAWGTLREETKHRWRLAASAALRASASSETAVRDAWVDANQQKPDTGVPVQVVYSGHVQLIAYKRVGTGFDCADGYEWVTAYDIGADAMPDGLVSHWRPMPVFDSSANSTAKEPAAR